MPFDEKWASVGKKERNCTPDETTAGDCWDHVDLDPHSRLVVSLRVGKRTADLTRELAADYHRRTGGRTPWRMTSDEYPAYADAIRAAYGQAVPSPAVSGGGVAGRPDVRDGSQAPCERAGGAGEYDVGVRHLGRSAAGAVGVSRQPGGERGVRRAAQRDGSGRCCRKGRKSDEFSKSWDAHVAATRSSDITYNFCWCVRSLRVKGADGRWQQCRPAMAAGLTDHVWSLREWITVPAVQRQ